jgi:hypothetical protein
MALPLATDELIKRELETDRKCEKVKTYATCDAWRAPGGYHFSVQHRCPLWDFQEIVCQLDRHIANA